MSEGTAGRRVTAARVCRRFPGVFERIARGELHLCALCALSPHLNEQNATELFEASTGKPRRQIEELLAVRFPRPDVREQIRRLPARAQRLTRLAAPVGMSGAVEQALARAIDPFCDPRGGVEPSADRSEAQEITADFARVGAETRMPAARPRSREIEPLSAERFGVHFTADAELRELIDRARALASHRVPNGDLAGLMKLMVASFVKQEEKRRFGIGTRPQWESRKAKSSGDEVTSSGSEAKSSDSETKSSGSETKSSGASEPAAPPGGASVESSTNQASTHATHPTLTGARPHSRYLAVRVRREIHARDGGQCAFVSAGGRRCNARAFIQFDHVEPFAWNGSSDAPNLRLLCKAHNLLHARECFGKRQIAAKIALRNGGVGSGPR